MNDSGLNQEIAKVSREVGEVKVLAKNIDEKVEKLSTSMENSDGDIVKRLTRLEQGYWRIAGGLFLVYVLITIGAAYYGM